MTQITGKIFPMYDKTGQNRRFPETVIEAVLGLSSYLQNQFSSLADIYMPIGGIYQSKTGQEFVYRATPNTIKAKSFTLDRIQGKSLAWNQLVQNGNFADGTTGWYFDGSGSVSNNEATITATSSVTGAYQRSLSIINGHKYLIKSDVKVSELKSVKVYFGTNTDSGIVIPITTANQYVKGSGIAQASQDYTLLQINVYGLSAGETITIRNVYLIDLTLLYGSEIDGMTDAQILAKFKSEYPGYHDYSAGKLISNDAKHLETVERNVWDEEWELGSLNAADGEEYPSTATIRSKNYIPVLPATEYYFTSNIYRVACYDANKNYIPSEWFAPNESAGLHTMGINTYYVRFYCASTYGTTYNNDICINLSDTSFNGQYEPYRKVVLPLNLDDFWVKDGQGNQVHITGGLKSAGSVRDEIVGNEHIERVGVYTFTGNEEWALNGSYQGVCKVNLPRKRSSDYWSQKANIIHEKYATGPQNKMYSGEDLDTIGANDSTSNGWIACGKNVYDNRASLTGTKLYFELATPIEYELVEPLIYTMKAGTTEARISPNEDGLSAPFCCDMTYSASDNNDADNAQYAATAGRLLNTHTILGQQFNGTQDIGGAISDVSSIDGAIHFDLTNPSSPLVGISTTSPTVRLDVNGEIKGSRLHSTVANGTAPLTVVSGTMVPTLNVEKVGGKTLAEILASDITGNAKTATNAKSESKTDQEFMFRKTNVDWDAKSGVVKKIKGKSLAWNQAIDISSIVSATLYNTTLTTEGNRLKLVLSDNNTSRANFSLTYAINISTFLAGHKYLISFVPSSNLAPYCYYGQGVFFHTTSSSYVFSTAIKEYNDINVNATLYVGTEIPAGTYYLTLQIIDLTRMFGAGNEPSSAAEFEALYPDAYYPYNPGTLISNDADAEETTGVNQWDEEWEVGLYSSGGAKMDYQNAIRTKNAIPVFPNTQYYISRAIRVGNGLFFYDANGNMISRLTGNIPQSFTTPAGCYQIRFDLDDSYGTTYNHDICINLSNAAINGQYFPYWKRDLQLNITTKKDTDGNIPFEDGMKGVGTVQDWCDKVGGEKRMMRVDLGVDLSWVYRGSDVPNVIAADISTLYKKGLGLLNALCAKYSNYGQIDGINYLSSAPDKSFAFYGGSASAYILYIKDSDISAADITGGKVAKLNGVMFDYELATPVPFTWAEPLPSVYPCDQYGTERIISPESTTPSAPFIADLQYGAKSDDVAKELIDTRAVVDTLLTSEKPALFSTVTATDAITLAGTTAAKKRIYFSDSVYLELDSNGLHLHGAGFYSDSFISAFGTNQTI